MGIEQTRGHTADGSGLRGHSVGDFYPYIVYATGPIDNIRWCIMKAGEPLPTAGDRVGWPTAKQACEWARIFKEDDDMQAAKTISPSSLNHGDPLCYGV